MVTGLFLSHTMHTNLHTDSKLLIVQIHRIIECLFYQAFYPQYKKLYPEKAHQNKHLQFFFFWHDNIFQKKSKNIREHPFK